MSASRRTASSPRNRAGSSPRSSNASSRSMSASTTPPGLEDELDEISGGRAQWQAVLEAFWKDFKPRTAEVMEFKPSEVTAAARPVPRALSVPRQGRWRRRAAVPQLRQGAARAARRQVRRVHRLLELSRVQIHPPLRAAGRRRGRGHRPGRAGQGSRDGPRGRAQIGAVRAVYPARRGQGRQARVDPQGYSRARPRMGAQAAEPAARGRGASRKRQRRSPRRSAAMARIWRMTANMRGCTSTAEVFETGMNAAVVKLAEAAANGGRPAARQPGAAQGAGRASAHRGRDQADGGALRRVRHRRHDQRDLAQVDRQGCADAGGSRATDRRARRGGAGQGQAQGAAKKKAAPKKKAAAKK